MPALALPAFWGAVSAGAAGGAGIYAAKKAGQANKEASQVTAQSNQAAIDEQKRQDAQQKEEFDAQQAMLAKQWDAQQALKAPYRAAGANALSSIGSILGVDFGAGGGGNAAAPSAALGPMPQGIDWTAPPDQLAQSLTNYFTKAGVSAHEVPYWVGKAGELVARGKETGDPNYANKRLAAADVFGGGGGAAPRSVAMPATAPMMAPALGNNLAAPYVPEIPITALMGR